MALKTFISLLPNMDKRSKFELYSDKAVLRIQTVGTTRKTTTVLTNVFNRKTESANPQACIFLRIQH